MSKNRPSNSKQRARKLAFLRARYGDNCWLCGEPMLFAARRTNQDSLATLDHVTPVYEGGQHGVINLRLAHRRCNTVRRGVESERADPRGNPQHRFGFRGKRKHFTRYWDMFRRIDAEGLLR